MSSTLTPEILLRAYSAGVFPMAESRDSGEIHWVDPNLRGIFPLEKFHISKSLRKSIVSGNYLAKFNTDFEGVLIACADRKDTWINAEIHELYMGLFSLGHAHSQEIWMDDLLVGGVYGVTIGQVFFGESMFSKRRDTSKIALAWLVDRLRRTGFTLFDTQFITPHLQTLGATEISRAAYHELLQVALQSAADIEAIQDIPTAQDVIQRSTQTS